MTIDQEFYPPVPDILVEIILPIPRYAACHVCGGDVYELEVWDKNVPDIPAWWLTDKYDGCAFWMIYPANDGGISYKEYCLDCGPGVLALHQLSDNLKGWYPPFDPDHHKWESE